MAQLKSYRVTWEIDVDAESPHWAAVLAMLMQGEHTTANVFKVRGWMTPKCVGRGTEVEIDLGDEPRHFLLEALEVRS